MSWHENTDRKVAKQRDVSSSKVICYIGWMERVLIDCRLKTMNNNNT